MAYSKRMRTVTVACIALAAGLVVGWSIRDEPRVVTKFVYRDVTVPTMPVAVVEKPTFPDTPKPPVEKPVPTVVAPMVSANAPIPTPLVGELPKLPAVDGPIAPITPAAPLPTADLNADEALARRLVLAAGGDVVSGSDAKDASGKVGRALVAEASMGGRVRIEGALRKALGDRVILSDGGVAGGSTAEIRKAEDGLLALRKQRDQARLDFLPNAPALQDLEDAFRRQERALAVMKRATSRQRLNILIRPVLGA